jgi:hypothetical protein
MDRTKDFAQLARRFVAKQTRRGRPLGGRDERRRAQSDGSAFLSSSENDSEHQSIDFPFTLEAFSGGRATEAARSSWNAAFSGQTKLGESDSNRAVDSPLPRGSFHRWAHAEVSGLLAANAQRMRLSELSRAFLRAAFALNVDLNALLTLLQTRRSVYFRTSVSVSNKANVSNGNRRMDGLSEAQRDEMDAEAAAHLQACKNGIRSLEELQRHSVDKISAIVSVSVSVPPTGGAKKAKGEGWKAKTHDGDDDLASISVRGDVDSSPGGEPTLSVVQRGIVKHLQTVLHRVTEVFTEQRQQRIRQQELVPADGFYRLRPVIGDIGGGDVGDSDSGSDSDDANGKEDQEEKRKGKGKERGKVDSPPKREEKNGASPTPPASDLRIRNRKKKRKSHRAAPQAPLDMNLVQATFGGVSAQEVMQLQQENSTLLTEFEHFSEATARIEEQVSAVGDLLQLFSAKVSEQHSDVVMGHELAVESTHNVDTGAEELIKATRRGVDMRIFVLLFMIVCSLALLFLHWIH